jgi:hypothetical protein
VVAIGDNPRWPEVFDGEVCGEWRDKDTHETFDTLQPLQLIAALKHRVADLESGSRQRALVDPLAQFGKGT